MNSFLVTPVELVRTRLMLQYGRKPSSSRRISGSAGGGDGARTRIRSPLDCVQQVVRRNGVLGMWQARREENNQSAPRVLFRLEVRYVLELAAVDFICHSEAARLTLLLSLCSRISLNSGLIWNPFRAYMPMYPSLFGTIAVLFYAIRFDRAFGSPSRGILSAWEAFS